MTGEELFISGSDRGVGGHGGWWVGRVLPKDDWVWLQGILEPGSASEPVAGPFDTREEAEAAKRSLERAETAG